MVDSLRTPTCSLHIELERGSDPIRGTIGMAGAAPEAFTGWIQLACVLEETLTRVVPARTDDRRSAPDEPRMSAA